MTSTSVGGTRPSSAESRPTSASTRRSSTCSNRGRRSRSPRTRSPPFEENKRVGLQKMEGAGAVGLCETALFELLGRAGTDEFKRIQKLILAYAPNPEKEAVELKAATSCSRTAPPRWGAGRLRRDHRRGRLQHLDDRLSGGGHRSLYAGQIITFTYPLIGNYGVSADAMESDRVQARGVIMREEERRGRRDGGGRLARLAARLRGGGDLRDRYPRPRPPHSRPRRDARGIFPAETSGPRRASGSPPSPRWRCRLRSRGDAGGADRDRRGRPPCGRARHRDQALHRRSAQGRSCRITLLPCDSSAEEVLARDPDLDLSWRMVPATPARSTTWSRAFAGWSAKPVVGICLGHQLLCRAVGLETFKLPFGHRGANHPVKDLETGRIDITSQNHGFAVRGRMAPGGSMGMNRSAGRPTSARPSSPTSISTTGPSRASSSRTSPATTSVPPGSRPGATTPVTSSTASWARAMTTDTASAVEAGHV